MKSKLWLLYPVLALLLMFSLGVPASAADPVPLPHNFYGSVTIGTEPAPPGKVVEARGEGVMTTAANPITTTEAGKYGGPGPTEPKLEVQGYIVDGTPIEFYVNGVKAQCREHGTEAWLDSYPWHTMGRTELDLRVGAAPAQYNLTVGSTAHGSVTTPGVGTFPYNAGTVVNLVAVADSGYQFTGWTGNVSTIANTSAATTTITMNGNYSITANFGLIGVTYNLTVASTAGGSVTTPGVGTFPYNAGTVVNLVAVANTGYQFVNWTGNVGTIANTSAATTTITMNGNYSITANFAQVVGNLGDLITGTPSGGTLELGAGTYTGNVVINKPITITGTTGTTIMGGITIGELTGSNVTIENLTFTGYTDFGIRIVKVRAVDTFIIRNNTIQGVAGSIIGIRVDEVMAGGSLTIERNGISGNQTGIKLLTAVANGTIKFNDITNNTTGLEMLAVGSNAKAEMNWWGNISGPKETNNNPGGTGNKIIGSIDYQPWLTRAFQTVLTDNIAYFGFPMVHVNAGWNVISTPIALDPACDAWGEYVALGDGLSIHATSPAYSFNSQTQAWVELTASYALKPCDAIYVRMAAADIAPILYSPELSVPSKQLYSGWNLVGLAYLGDIRGLKATDALVSVEEVSGGLTGYKLVVSPPVNQPGWVYTGGAIADWNGQGEPPAGWMMNTIGYWVFVLNDGILAGFTFTPRSL